MLAVAKTFVSNFQAEIESWRVFLILLSFLFNGHLFIYSLIHSILRNFNFKEIPMAF